MFQTSGAHTDELLYESAVLASEIDQGLSFEDTLKALRKRLCSGSESDIEHLEANEKKIALGRHSEKNKGLFGNYSQTSTPPFGNPLLKKNVYILHFFGFHQKV